MLVLGLGPGLGLRLGLGQRLGRVALRVRLLARGAHAARCAASTARLAMAGLAMAGVAMAGLASPSECLLAHDELPLDRGVPLLQRALLLLAEVLPAVDHRLDDHVDGGLGP